MSFRTPLGATSESAGLELTGRRPRDARARTNSSRRALTGLTGVMAGALLIAVSAANTQTLLPESIRPVPQALAGAFASTGLNLHSGGAIAALSMMFVSYVVVLGASSRLSGRTVLICIAALHAVVLLAPPLFSTDMFSYQAYARMGALYGADPYLIGPHAIALDPVFPYIGAKWSYIPSVYGPAFTALSYVLAPLSIAAGVIAYKSIAVLASLAMVALVWNVSRLRGIDPVRSVALVGLNPLLVLYGVGGGHNDMLMLLAVVGALYAILAGRDRLGGAMTVLAIGIKLTAVMILPFAIAARGPHRGRSRRRDLLLGAGAGLGLIGAVSFALYGPGVVNVLSTVSHNQSVGDWHTIPGFISTRLGLVSAGHIAGYCLAALFAGISVWLLRRVWRGEIDWIAAAGWCTAAMLLCASSLLPWYVAWLLPLAALGGDRRLQRTAIWITGVIMAVQMLGYIPHGFPGV